MDKDSSSADERNKELQLMRRIAETGGDLEQIMNILDNDLSEKIPSDAPMGVNEMLQITVK
jgi:hypothetical protein